jgi:hypothetical protein
LETNEPISTTIRRAVRENHELGVRASSTNRELAIYFLTMKPLNVLCLYHCHNDKKGGKVDGQDKKYKVMGIPLPRKVNEVKGDKIKRPEGYMHCGCDEDIVLAEFYIWKNWMAMSGGYTEGMKDKIMDPCIRAFMVGTGLFQIACVLVDDFYTRGHTERETEKAMIHNQIERLKADLRDMEKEDENKVGFILSTDHNHLCVLNKF